MDSANLGLEHFHDGEMWAVYRAVVKYGRELLPTHLQTELGLEKFFIENSIEPRSEEEDRQVERDVSFFLRVAGELWADLPGMPENRPPTPEEKRGFAMLFRVLEDYGAIMALRKDNGGLLFFNEQFIFGEVIHEAMAADHDLALETSRQLAPFIQALALRAAGTKISSEMYYRKSLSELLRRSDEPKSLAGEIALLFLERNKTYPAAIVEWATAEYIKAIEELEGKDLYKALLNAQDAHFCLIFPYSERLLPVYSSVHITVMHNLMCADDIPPQIVEAVVQRLLSETPKDDDEMFNLKWIRDTMHRNERLTDEQEERLDAKFGIFTD